MYSMYFAYNYAISEILVANAWSTLDSTVQHEKEEST